MSLVRLKIGGEAGADQAALERLWSLALARAGQEELGAALRVVALRVDRCAPGELVETLPEPALILMLDDSAGEGLATAVLDGPLMTGMVEAMTTGSVTAADAAGRRPTRTDAALLAPVIDRALAVLEAGAAEAGLAAFARGFRFASVAEGARALSLLLEDGPYRRLAAEVDLAGGARQGRLWLALPEQRPSVIPQVADGETLRFRSELRAQVEGASVRLDAVLHRMTLPLGQVMTLQVGQSLPLPRAEIGRIAVEGLDGRQVAVGRLGRHGSLRALRLLPEAGEALPAARLSAGEGLPVSAMRAGPAA